MIKLLIGVLIIACIAPLFIKGPDGEPIMTFDDWSIDLPDSIDELLSTGNTEPADPEQSQPTTVYKWQDENGQWHFSSTPPDLETAETMELDGNINIMDAFEPPPREETTVATGDAMSPVPGLTTATPSQIQEAMETVTNLQETIDQRKEDLDAVAGFDN